MSTVAHPISYDELLKENGGKLYELVRGERVEKVMAFESIWIVSQILHLLKSVAERNGHGWVLAEQPIACFPWLDRHARRPDVLFISRQRHPSARSQVAALPYPPELCVEVISPHDDALELDIKIDEYLRAGVSLVWIVNPAVRTVRVHRADGSIEQFNADATLTAEAVIPDFSAKVADFFPPA